MAFKSPTTDYDVLVVGGGPAGLILSIELGRRGVRTLLVDEKAATATNPQANATQARTMEHYRRLGISDDVRQLGLPKDHPTDIAYFTRLTHQEIARFSLPASGQSKGVVRKLKGSWSAAELPHRVSQKFVEPILRREAEACASVEARSLTRLVSFVDRGDHVESVIQDVEGGGERRVTSRFMVGADGGRSLVREELGFVYEGELVDNREMMGGQMLAVYLRAPDFFDIMPHPKAWMYWTFNKQRRSWLAAVDGKQDFAFHTQVRPGEVEGEITADVAKEMFFQALGRRIDVEVLSYGPWTAGYALVVNKMRKGNVFIAGDAAHLFTPAGGLGYNTAVEDAVNLAWKLATVIAGNGGPALLDSYEEERRPLAIRNTGYARGFADSMGLYYAPEEIEDDTPAGEKARQAAGEYFNAHTRAEFNIPGITFGGRYDGSPVIFTDPEPTPPDSASEYVPTGKPGGRPPHVWLSDDRSIFDLFGRDWTVLRLGDDAPEAARFVAAAEKAGMMLQVVTLKDEEVRDLYGASLVLIRPDQIVAWRGESDEGAASVLALVTGRASNDEQKLAGIGASSCESSGD